MDYKTLFRDLIKIMIEQGASDLHLGAGRYPGIRVNGDLTQLMAQPILTQEDMNGILQSVLSEDKYNKFITKQELDFSYEYEVGARLRVNAFVQQAKFVMVLRLIPQVRTFEELKLPPILAEFAHKKQGFFLVVGPVGSGKSSSLAAMINLINEERPAHILTIEDPVEYVYTPKKSVIDQREIGLDTESFPVALKSALREDMNVILIGEMRNAETIGAAVTAAETGHLVFSTLHTNTAGQTVDRIIDSFPGDQQDQVRMQLAASLLGVFSQRLIPGVNGGRVPAYELLINNTAVANLIREKRTHEIDMVIETGFELGMVDMNRCLVDLVKQGLITVENAYAYSTNPKNLERLL